LYGSTQKKLTSESEHSTCDSEIKKDMLLLEHILALILSRQEME